MIAVTFLLLALLIWQAQCSFELQVVEDVMEGIIVGYIEGAVPDLAVCLKDAGNVYNDINAAIRALQMDNGMQTEIKAALKDLGNAIISLAEAIKPCHSIVSEVESLITQVEKDFIDPANILFQVGEDLLIHGISIYDEIKDGVTLWENGSYFSSGKEFGEALHLLLNGRRLKALRH
jgi:hypothetical protein